MFAVVVTLRIHPDQMAAFLPAMQANAAASLKEEPGCRRFDVCTDPDRPDEVFLYELYDDAAAFDAHLTAAHFKQFDETVGPMVAHKDVRTFAEVRT